MLEKLIHYWTKAIACLCTLSLIGVVLCVFSNMFLRYTLDASQIWLSELSWHLFATLFLFGISYTLIKNAHVRVDIIAQKFKPEWKLWIDTVGTLLFIIPLSIFIVYYGGHFSYNAFTLGEQSANPGGLPFRWLIKSMMPISFIALIISCILMRIKAHTTEITNKAQA